MSLENPSLLEKIVNRFRISPHGILPTALATSMVTDRIFNLGFYENLPPNIQDTIPETSAVLFLFGFFHLKYGIEKYRDFRHNIIHMGLNENHVKTKLKYYCSRQAYKAAAYSLGFGEDFNRINREFPNEEKYFRWVPEI